MTLREIVRSVRIIGLAAATTAAMAAGCSGSSYGGSPNLYGMNNPTPSPSPSIAPGAQIVGINLTGEMPTVDPTYGRVLGYFVSSGSINMTSQVVHLTAAMPVVFESFDGGLPHTASFLGNASAGGATFPGSFNGSSSASPAATLISTANFSTGTLNPGSSSLQYGSGPPGFFMFGCAFHYNADGMRTLIIVQ